MRRAPLPTCWLSGRDLRGAAEDSARVTLDDVAEYAPGSHDYAVRSSRGTPRWPDTSLALVSRAPLPLGSRSSTEDGDLVTTRARAGNRILDTSPNLSNRQPRA